jgi:hypothetical protein
MALNELDRFVVVLITTDEEEPRPRDLSAVDSDNVRADKTVIAQIFDSQTGMVIESVRKLNEYAFPVNRKLPGVLPHIVGDENVQPNYVEVYLRVKRPRADERQLRAQEIEYDLQRFPVKY